MPKYTKNHELPTSPAFAAFAAATVKRMARRSATLEDFNESGKAHAAALGIVHTPCESAAPSVKPTIGAGKQSRAKAAKRAEKRQQALAAGVLDNKELKAYDLDHPRTKVKSNRKQNLATAQVLWERVHERGDALHKAAHKLRLCSTAGAFRVLSQGVCHKTGQALCRSRVCPTCQRALAHKRRAAFLRFFEINSLVMSGFYFYHMVLTLRHSREEGIRDNLYTKQLVDSFKILRGTSFDKASGAGLCEEDKEYWNQRVAGGIYSVETVPGFDGSPHIHLHVLLLAKMPLWRKSQSSKFLTHIKSRWLEITSAGGVEGASTQVHLEPVYTWKLDESGQPLRDKLGNKIKDYVTKGRASATGGTESEAEKTGYDHLKAGVSECAKYTLKTDEASLNQFSDAFLYDLIETRHRYYGRFGCLHSRSKDSSQFAKLHMLNGDFKDLEQVDADLLRQLYNPVTRQTVAKSDTVLVVTNFRNTTAHTAPGSLERDEETGLNRGLEPYYSINDMTKAAEFSPEAGGAVAKALSVTLYRRYDAANDIGAEDEPEPVQKSTSASLSIPLITNLCPLSVPFPSNSLLCCLIVPTRLLVVNMPCSAPAWVLTPYRPGSWPGIGVYHSRRFGKAWSL